MRLAVFSPFVREMNKHNIRLLFQLSDADSDSFHLFCACIHRRGFCSAEVRQGTVGWGVNKL